MKNERTIAITLVVVIILLLSALIVLTNKDIFENLFSEGKAIKYNDCVDIHYIGKHENGGIFAYSYDNLTKKTGENTLKIFVTNSSSAAPPKDFETYSNNFSYSNPYDFSGEKQYYFEELIQSLVGMKKGETKTIGPITPVGNFGVEPEIGDKIDLSALVGVNNTIYSVFDKQEDVPIPEEYKADLGDITTTLYTLRQEFYNVGDSMDAMYPFWKNSSVVTKINETLKLLKPEELQTSSDGRLYATTFFPDFNFRSKTEYRFRQLDEKGSFLEGSTRIADTDWHTYKANEFRRIVVRPSKSTGLDNYITYFSTPALFYSIENSVFISILVTTITVSLAFGFAYALTRSTMRFKGLFRIIAMIPILIPSLLPGIALVYLFGSCVFPGYLYHYRIIQKCVCKFFDIV